MSDIRKALEWYLEQEARANCDPDHHTIDLREFSRIARAALADDGWRDISTAARDGTPILVCGGTWYSDGGESGGYSGTYPLEGPRIVRWFKDAWHLGNGTSYNEEYWAEPAYWRPLPPGAPAMTDAREIDVCSKCLMACCWYGVFLCDEAETADVIKMPVSELEKLAREHPSWWTEEAVRKYVYGD